jgi:glycine cleavage system protein P-like pyridoxal-binding family
MIDFPKIITEAMVTDMTGSESDFTLDDNGFQLLNHQSCMTEADFLDDEKVKHQYYPETEQLLKRVYLFQA